VDEWMNLIAREDRRGKFICCCRYSFGLLPFVYDGYMIAWPAMDLPASVCSLLYWYFLQIYRDEIIQSHLLPPRLGDRVRLWPGTVAFAQ
jgi:hypothetical protein